MLTADRLHELLFYRPEVGLFFWKDTSRLVGSNAGRAGLPAGSVNSRGYRTIKVDGRYYKAHRLAFLYVTGHWPSGVVDHINWDTDDNRWANLRDVSQAVNSAHRKPHSNQGGLHFSKRKRRWEARITRDRRRIYLGSFATREEANTVRANALSETQPTNKEEPAA